jgi:gamma-butyrobetaine dioxygenase
MPLPGAVVYPIGVHALVAQFPPVWLRDNCPCAAVAAALRAGDPMAFAVLARIPVTFRFAAPGVDLTATAPLIAVDPRSRIRGIRYNNRSAQPPQLLYPEAVEFYAAYRCLARLIADPSAQLRLRLGPGDCLVVDNTRILHARTGFSGTGSRHLQGCYADLDAVESAWRSHRPAVRLQGTVGG